MIHLLFHNCRSPRVLSDLSFFQCATLFPKSRLIPVSYRRVSKPDRRSTSRIWRIRPRASSLHRKREKKEFQVHLVCLRTFLRRQCVPRETVRTHLPLPLSFRRLSDAVWTSLPPCEANIHPIRTTTTEMVPLLLLEPLPSYLPGSRSTVREATVGGGGGGS